MTGRDPAVEAARRACGSTDFVHPNRCLETAAREALKPIQAKHRPVAWTNRRKCCVTCFDANGGPQEWPCETAPLIYSDEELNQ